MYLAHCVLPSALSVTLAAIVAYFQLGMVPGIDHFLSFAGSLFLLMLFGEMVAVALVRLLYICSELAYACVV